MSKNQWLEMWGFNVKAARPSTARRPQTQAQDTDQDLEKLLRRLTHAQRQTRHHD